MRKHCDIYNFSISEAYNCLIINGLLYWGGEGTFTCNIMAYLLLQILATPTKTIEHHKLLFYLIYFSNIQLFSTLNKVKK